MAFVLILILMVVVILIITLLRKIKFNLPIHVFFVMVIFSISLISVFLFSTTVVSEIHLVNTPKFIFICIAAFIIYMNLCILYLYINLGRYYKQFEKAITQKRVLKAELKYLQQLKDSQSKLYSMKHDLKNQYVVLLGMLHQHDITGATLYLQDSIETIEDSDYFYTNNFVLNYLLNEKVSTAKCNGVTLSVQSFLPEKLRLDTDVLAVVLGNLIDNSLEAVLRLSHYKEKEISLLIKHFDHNLLIEISNVFEREELRTRKHRQTEGIGIKNIKRIVEEHGGIYNQWFEENRYVVSILLLGVYGKRS